MPGGRRWPASMSEEPLARSVSCHAERSEASRCTDWAGLDAMSSLVVPPRDDILRCPFCEAENAELISLFGSQLLTSQYRCRECGSYFEAIRRDEDGS